jgi:hypothetical protein
VSLEREVLLYRTEARQESLRACRIAEATHASLAFARRLMTSVFGPVIDPRAGFDEQLVAGSDRNNDVAHYG